MPADRQWFFASFRLDPATMCLWRDNQLVPLASKPFAVLAYLVAHAGQVVTKEALLEAVWPGTVVSEGVLKTSMGKLRQALGETARTPYYIDTVHGRGYRFIAPVEERLSEPADDCTSRRSTPASSQSPDPGPCTSQTALQYSCSCIITAHVIHPPMICVAASRGHAYRKAENIASKRRTVQAHRRGRAAPHPAN